MPKKVDFKKDYKEVFTASAKKAVIVKHPAMQYLTSEGTGHPNNSPLFQSGMQALFSIGYTLKYTLRKTTGDDFSIPAICTRWKTVDGSAFAIASPNNWQWTLMLAVPDWITKTDFKSTVKELTKKKPEIAEALARVSFVKAKAETVVQMMHVGHYEKEKPTIDAMMSFVNENGYVIAGDHHELYLNDPRRVPADKWKTILRYPVKRV